MEKELLHCNVKRGLKGTQSRERERERERERGTET